MNQNKRLIAILFVVALLLLLPFVAMQFTEEVTWTAFDFIAAGALLFSTGLIIELVLRKVKKLEHRIIICLVILGVFFLIWLELAVGIFDTSFSGS